jgi:general secretion pathway protein C
LFGEQQQAPVTASPARVMPQTRLKLILRGVVAGEDGSGSGAIIASPSGEQSFYPLGADLPGGAVLKEVHDRHIVLLRNGQLETLQLPVDNLDVTDGGAFQQNSATPGGAAPLMSLSEYRDTLLQNPQQLADVVQARLYHRNGVTGYQISPGRDPALFRQLGLQDKDVITMVNGIRLDNPARGLSILQSLRQQSHVTVEVLRNGTPQRLSIDLNQ